MLKLLFPDKNESLPADSIIFPEAIVPEGTTPEEIIGADCIRPPSIDQSASEGLQRAEITAGIVKQEQLQQIPKPPIIGVLGAKGGVGATSVVVNLAVAIAKTGVRTTILDANFQQPDASQLLGIEPEHSLMEIISRAPHIDQQLFEACCTALSGSQPGLSLLSPPIDGEAALKANLSQLAASLKLMHCYSGFWLLDLPKHLDKHLVTLTDLCDKIVLVFEATVAGVAGCRRWLNLFSELGYEQDKIICLLNRAGSKYTDVEKQLTDCFAGETIYRLPNASAASWESSTRGVPLVLAQPNHQYAKAILKLAENICQPML